MQIIFQDPYASLDPRMTVGTIVGEGLIIHGLTKTRREFEERVVEVLETVGLGADHLRRYPPSFRAASASVSASLGHWRCRPSLLSAMSLSRPSRLNTGPSH